MLSKWLRPAPIIHPTLGTLEWRSGAWEGHVQIPGHAATVRISGARGGPTPEAAAAVEAMISGFPGVVSELERHLHDHYEPYRDAFDSGRYADFEGSFPRIASGDAAWSYVSEVCVSAWAEGKPGQLQVELNVPWDPEHTLGAVFQGARLVEFSGSV